MKIICILFEIRKVILMREEENIAIYTKEYKRWYNMMDDYLTELMALKESIREIYNVDNTLASKVVPFEAAVNNRVVMIKDLKAKIYILEGDVNQAFQSAARRNDQYKINHEKLKKEIKKAHKDHLALLDNFFNEVIM